MSFSDPITITINAVAKTLAKINQDTYGSEYFLRESLQEFRVKIRNTSYTNPAKQVVDRHNIEFTNVVYATTTAPALTRKAYTVYENVRSDTDASVLQDFVGFVAFNTSANIQKLLNYES
jgi:hypothetical protein